MSGSSVPLSSSSDTVTLGPTSWTLVARAPFTRRSWRELVYALVAFPLGVLGFAFVLASLFFGALFSLVVVGLVILALSTLGARQIGSVNRALVRHFLDEDAPPPPPFTPQPGLVGWIRSGLADRVGWRCRAYLVLKFPLAIAALLAVLALRVVSLWFMLAPLQWATDVGTETVVDHGIVHPFVINFGSFYFDTWPRTLLLTGIGVVGWWLAPWGLRAVLYLDRHLLADLLGPTSLPTRLRQLERARAGVADEASTRLRRLERDLHDGAQAELVGLAMKLGLAQARLAEAQRHPTPSEIVRIRRLVDDAHDRADTALRQLRDLARGIYPSELAQGLDAALAMLADRCPLLARATVTLNHRPSPAIEEIVYFCAAEVITNAVKHSGASALSIELIERGNLLRLTVSDDGVGGARIAERGLRGLVERLSTVDGQLWVSSPTGGPTVVTIELPTRP